jgi:hypothetical protein
VVKDVGSVNAFFIVIVLAWIVLGQHPGGASLARAARSAQIGAMETAIF